MLAFSRRLALAFAALIALGAIGTIGVRPAAATTCTATPTSGSGVTSSISDCSEVLTINPGFSVTVGFPVNGSSLSNNGFNPNGVLIGVVNNSGVAIQDLMLIGNTGMPIFNIVPSETLCFTNIAPGNCSIGGTATAPINGKTYTITGNEGKILGNSNLVYFTSIGIGNATANNQGDIVFDGGLPSSFTAYLALTNLAQAVCVTNANGQCITTASEPASLFLLGSGLLGVIAFRRRITAFARRPKATKNHTRLYWFQGKSFCALKSAMRRSASR